MWMLDFRSLSELASFKLTAIIISLQLWLAGYEESLCHRHRNNHNKKNLLVLSTQIYCSFFNQSAIFKQHLWNYLFSVKWYYKWKLLMARFKLVSEAFALPTVPQPLPHKAWSTILGPGCTSVVMGRLVKVDWRNFLPKLSHVRQECVKKNVF